MPWRKQASDGSPTIFPAFKAGLSNLGNTGGISGVAPGRIVFAATGQYSFSQSSASTGATVTLSGDGYMKYYGVNTVNFYCSSTQNMGQNEYDVVRFDLPSQMSFTEVDVPVSISANTAAADATAANVVSAFAVLYTRSNSNLIPLIGMSSTTTYTWDSNSGVYSSLTGPRIMSFALATTLSAGEYYFGHGFITNSTFSTGTATTALAMSIGRVIQPAQLSIASYWDMSAPNVGIAPTNGSVTDMGMGLTPLVGRATTALSATSQWLMPSDLNNNPTANYVIILRGV